jgi:hypothetical protein
VNPRALLAPVLAAALVSGVLGVQVAHGGGDFVPARPADPCAARVVRSVSTGFEALSERLVLLGLDAAGCRLGMTREALLLDLALHRTHSQREIDAVRAGLLAAVARMKAGGSLPKASALADEALDQADLNGFLKAVLRALPDSVIDAGLRTDDVLRRAITALDLRTLLASLDEPDAINRQIGAAIQQAVKDSLVARLRGLI